ncbi:transcription factor GTE1-like isoform X2 [Asparagus officinalis]|uniref:transcription factor GTE1-like isoform X1 n=1 Tax=Asparagus officinalis TaxID=4686 RepID=UPI00098E1EEE|nr:transcription factor GTE1-like isoform X1 [Asparagus officinalis]XP_020245935.1 transcription factor GTE1-like isoform X2 [Asparagus officinalis]
MISKANELEQRVKELTDFYTHKKQPKNLKWISSCLKDKTDGAQKESGCSERMQEVMCQFGTILKQLSAHKWAEPFLEPVDVKGLRLRDYYKIIKRPMDFSTIQKQMEANVYKNAREIYADVRLVFSNAMTYNEDNKHDIHVMAKTLQQKFEEKWIHLIPKVVAAEKRQIDEEAQALAAQEAAIAKLARDTNNELNHLNLLIEELRESVMQRCRKMSTEEKRKLSSGIASLCPEYLFKALELIAQSNPNFQDSAEEVDIDIDAQSEITLRRLKFFVKGALENQAKNSATKAKNQSADADDISNRKRVICDALAKTARKRSKKLTTVS